MNLPYRNFRILILVLGLSLSGCGPASIILTPIESIDKVPLKVTPLTDAEQLTWGHMDLELDTVPGMSINRAYKEIIKDQKGAPVVVAVIDSGIDIDHEDLSGSIWTNTDEIPDNNIDDDGNGYVDDVHGWNYLGKTRYEQFEYVRLLLKGNTFDPDYDRAQAEYNKNYRKNFGYKGYYEEILVQIEAADEAIKAHLNKEEYTVEDLDAIVSEDSGLMRRVSMIQSIMGDNFETVQEVIDALHHDLDIFNEHLDYHLNKSFKGRSTGDDPDDFTQIFYGDNNVKPINSDETHGTHVAGIIAANRTNGIGAKGVANNVRIMALRAVPDGDEYDKDVALAIYYAADNGAKVINMSFGKYYSPHKEKVQEAIRYAAQKDVLIVSGAGNESLNVDERPNYPNDTGNAGEVADNFIEVGATEWRYGSDMIADYSNYGKSSVDIFAPGSKIHSTFPENSYKAIDGTSMAAPAVVGIAALVRSYYPDLSASQVKRIILSSGLPLATKVLVPGESERVEAFKDLSKSGRLANAYNALIMAGDSLE